MKTALQILKEAKATISNPDNWTKGAYARTRNHLPIESTSYRACSFCALGAMTRVSEYNVVEFGKAAAFVRNSISANKNVEIIAFNDSRDHLAIMKMFDRAILLAKQAEARAERKS